jgi:F-type H+-transporting ATPase subunit epsilon
MADTLQLEIVTPGAVIYSEAVDMVTLPGSEGETGIYPNHIPLMTKIQAGELIAKKAGSEEILAVSEGFAEITGDRVSILTDNAANSADIDESTVEEARTKAEKRLKEGDISEEEVKILNQAILYSAAQIRAKRRRG